MRRWGRAAFALSFCVGCAGAAGACASFSPADSGEGVTEGGTEGGPADSGPADDGGGPADAGWTPCVDRPADPAHFCDDFDDPGAIGFKWSKDVNGDGSVGETDAAVSPPRALLSAVAAGSATQGAVLWNDRGKLLDISTKSRIRFAFSFRVAKPPYPSSSTDGFTQIASLDFDDPSCPTSGSNLQRQVEISFDTSGALYVRSKGLRDLCPDAGDYFTTPTPLPLASFVSDRDFRRVTVEIARASCNGQGNASLKVAIEGAPDIPCVSLGSGDPLAHATGFAVGVGAYAESSSGDYAETEIAYDNVTVDIE
jgi:hypothetical protein